MATHCPKCGIKYNWFDRLAQPNLCAKCEDQFGLQSPLASFEDDLAKVRASEAAKEAGLRVVDQTAVLEKIAWRNLKLGMGLFVVGVVLPFPLLALMVTATGGGYLFISGALIFGGLERGIRGFFQLRALRRQDKYGIPVQQ